MPTTTTVFNLFLYPDTEFAGAPVNCKQEAYSSLEEAARVGDAYDGVMYEVQCVSTTTEPPSKKYPEGQKSTSKTICVRKTLKDPSWWAEWQEAQKNRMAAAAALAVPDQTN